MLLRRRWQRQLRGESERKHGFRRKLDLFVSSQSTSHETSSGTYKGTDASSFSSTGYTSDQRTSRRSSTGSSRCTLALAFDRTVESTGLDLVGLPIDSDGSKGEGQLALALYLALFLCRNHRARHAGSLGYRRLIANGNGACHGGEKSLT
jgi:hypothetical protein